MNYPETFKEKMVLRMSGPSGISANALSEEVGIAQTSLSRWLREAAGVENVAKKVNGKSNKAKGARRPQDWTAEEKLEEEKPTEKQEVASEVAEEKPAATPAKEEAPAADEEPKA